jgi:hypothetical protein
VKINWFSDGGNGATNNDARGAHDQGAFHVYAVRQQTPIYLGAVDGDGWRPLASKSRGWMDIEASRHWSADKTVIEEYRCSNGTYRLVSSVLWQLGENGPRKKLKVFK